MITIGSHIAWSSFRPRRSFAGTVVSVGETTDSGRMRYVKIGRLVVR